MKKTLTIFFLILAGVFVAGQSAQAFWDVPYNMANMQLNALAQLEENPVMRLLIALLLFVVESTAFAFISANLLDWASSLPVGLNNNLINSGWGFTAGLVNIIFILIFIAIAFFYIFKTETWGMKKALPRLIIIAILINFSLLFVKMLADAGWIVQYSLKNALFSDGKLAVAALEPLKNSAIPLISFLAVIPGGYALLSLIPVPFLSTAGSGAVALLALAGEAFFGTLTQTILLIVFNFIVGLVFLIYAILFLVRIGVIWLLAIMAPLAFAAFILPQTQKFFTQWLKTLFQWAFLGAIMFFLMGLGIRLFGGMADATPVIKGPGGWEFFGAYYKYIFLLVYLIVVLMFTKKLVPIGAEAVWGLGGMALGRAQAVAAGQTRKWGTMAGAAVQQRRAEMARKVQQGEKLTFGQRVTAGIWTRRPEVAGQIRESAEARAAVARAALVQQEKSNLAAKTKGMDEETAKAVLLAEMTKHSALPEQLRKMSPAKSAALMEALAEKNALKVEHKKLYEEAWQAAGTKDAKTNRVKRAVLERMLHWGSEDEINARIKAMNASDIDKLSGDAKKDPEIISRIVGTMRSDFINRLGSQNQSTFELVQKAVDEAIGKRPNQSLALDALNEKQLKLLRYFHTSPGFGNVEWDTYGTTLDNIKERIENFGKPQQKTAKQQKPGPGTQQPPFQSSAI